MIYNQDPELLKQFEQDSIPCHWHVYALKDPHDGAVRYAGITFNPDQRLNGHLAEQSDSRKSAWIATLRKRGLAPELHVLESGDGGWSAQAECEQRWIARFRPTGKLFNLTSGGETGRGRGAERVTYTPECSARRRAGRKPKRAYGELPGEAEVVQRIRELWAQEYGYLTIAKDLNEAGIKTRLKGRWYISTVKRVLVELGLEFPRAESRKAGRTGTDPHQGTCEGQACFNRFKSCVTKDKGASTVKLERLGMGTGRSSHMTFGRKTEEYIADFYLICKRVLTEAEWELFRFHYLLGADWNLLKRHFTGLSREAFVTMTHTMEYKLGAAFRETAPFALYPLDEYFSSTIRGGSVEPTELPKPARLHVLWPPMRPAVIAA